MKEKCMKSCNFCGDGGGSVCELLTKYILDSGEAE